MIIGQLMYNFAKYKIMVFCKYQQSKPLGKPKFKKNKLIIYI